MNLFSYIVQAFHNMGLLQFFALYLYNENLCSYKNFYTSLLDYFLLNPDTVAGKVFNKVSGYLDGVLEETGNLTCSDERFGKVQWPFEEYIYLCAAYELDKFYDETADFLATFGIEKEIFEDLLNFQRKITKMPFDSEVTIESDHNFGEYFNNLLDSKPATLKAEKLCKTVTAKPFADWEHYAKVVVWYGRMGWTSFKDDVTEM